MFKKVEMWKQLYSGFQDSQSANNAVTDIYYRHNKTLSVFFTIPKRADSIVKIWWQYLSGTHIPH